MTKKSNNTKIGKVAATYASQATCPTTCTFRNSGCYAETGNTGFTTRRLNKSEGYTPVEIAKMEADMIRKLPGDRPLRVHVVGDCADNESAEHVGGAMAEYPQPSWTYTHAWRDVKVESWKGANVIASCETPEDVKAARAKGYATALVVPDFPDEHKAFEVDGVRVLPCPEQSRGTTCEECLLCTKTAKLKEHGVTIGFKVHGAQWRKALSKIVEEVPVA